MYHFTSLLRDTPRSKELRVERKWSEVNWGRVWRNLWEAPVDMAVNDICYRVLHDILPTKTWLKAICMSPDDACAACHLQDTIPHRLVEWGDEIRQWAWLRTHLGMIFTVRPKRHSGTMAVSAAISLLAPSETGRSCGSWRTWLRINVDGNTAMTHVTFYERVGNFMTDLDGRT
jgi:hypothetical protein